MGLPNIVTQSTNSLIFHKNEKEIVVQTLYFNFCPQNLNRVQFCGFKYLFDVLIS